MTQNISYGIGQYRRNAGFDYITNLTMPDNYIDYLSYTSKTTLLNYQDIKIELPDGIEYGESYCINLDLPRNPQYDLTVNVKLCTEDETNQININNFQQIQQLIVPALDQNTGSYEKVVLYEIKDSDNLNNPGVIYAEIPKIYTQETNLQVGCLYEDNNAYKHCKSTSGSDENKFIILDNEGNNPYTVYYLQKGWRTNISSEIGSSNDTDNTSSDINNSNINNDTSSDTDNSNNEVDNSDNGIDNSNNDTTNDASSDTTNDSNIDDIVSYKIIFSPKYNLSEKYKYLWLEIVHNNDSDIYYLDQDTVYDGNRMPKDKISCSISKITNLLAKTEYGIAPIKSGTTTLRAVTVIGPTDLQLTINGEDIRIGVTGQYTLENFDITFLGVVIDSNSNSDFLIEYTYEIES